MMERVVGVIRDATRRRKHGLPELCDLYFTDRRLIVAVLISQASLIAYSMGYGFGGRLSSWYFARREKEEWRKMAEGRAAEEIYQLRPENYELRYEYISSVRLKLSKLLRSLGTYMEFITIAQGVPEKVKFNFNPKQFDEAARIISSVLRGKISLS